MVAGGTLGTTHAYDTGASHTACLRGVMTLTTARDFRDDVGGVPSRGDSDGAEWEVLRRAARADPTTGTSWSKGATLDPRRLPSPDGTATGCSRAPTGPSSSDSEEEEPWSRALSSMVAASPAVVVEGPPRLRVAGRGGVTAGS
jgi:hypothetical protein